MKELENRINKALEEIKPFLHTDGGDVELVEIKEDKVTVKFLGNCIDCSINKMTLKSGIEMTIKKHAPEIKEVVNI